MTECGMNTKMYKSLYETNAEHSVTQVERKKKKKKKKNKFKTEISEGYSIVCHIQLDVCLTYFILKEINNKVDILTSIINVIHISCAKFSFRNDIMAHKIKKTVPFTR